jgi:hypothetical protein
MRELLFRFAIGGSAVSLFAALGGVLKPKSFAGLFGAAPSVALATLSLTTLQEGKPYTSLEARSMIAGAIGFFVYACCCMRLMKKYNVHSAVATLSMLAAWLLCAFGALRLLFR